MSYPYSPEFFKIQDNNLKNLLIIKLINTNISTKEVFDTYDMTYCNLKYSNQLTSAVYKLCPKIKIFIEKAKKLFKIVYLTGAGMCIIIEIDTSNEHKIQNFLKSNEKEIEWYKFTSTLN